MGSNCTQIWSAVYLRLTGHPAFYLAVLLWIPIGLGIVGIGDTLEIKSVQKSLLSGVYILQVGQMLHMNKLCSMLESDTCYGKETKWANGYQIYKDWDCMLDVLEKISMRKWSKSKHLRHVIFGRGVPQAEGAVHEAWGRSVACMFEAGGHCGPSWLARARVGR